MSEGFTRNTLHSSVAALTYSLGRFITTVVLARTVGVHETGVVNYIIWLVALVGAITDMGAHATLSRFLPEVSRPGAGTTVESLVRHLFWPFVALVSIPPLVLMCIFVAAAWGVQPISAVLSDPKLVMLAVALYWMQVLSNFALGYLVGMQKFRRIVVFAAVAMSLQILVVAAGGGVWGAHGALLGFVIGYAVPAGLCVCFIGRWLPLSGPIRQRVHRFAAYSWASTIAAALAWGRLETAFLNHYWGSESVGLYSVGFTLASLAVQAPLLFTGALLPFFSEIASSQSRHKMQAGLETGTRFLIFVTLPLTFITAAIVPHLLILIFGREFAPASYACMILIVTTGLVACTTVATNMLLALERSDFMFISHVFAALLSISFSILLVPDFGINGAAIARAAAQISVLVLTLWFVQKRMAFTLPLADSLSLLVAACAAGAVAYVSSSGVTTHLSLLGGVLAAACTYLIIVRLLRAIPERDVTTLRVAIGRLPGAQQAVINVIFDLVSPTTGKR